MDLKKFLLLENHNLYILLILIKLRILIMVKPPKFIGKAKITQQGQLTLPQEARSNLGIPLGSEVYWYEFDDYLVVVKDLVNQKDLIKKIKK